MQKEVSAGKSVCVPEAAGGRRKNFRKSAAREIAYIALCVSLITVCAWISVPITAIPVTLQTFAVALIGALMGWKRGTIAVAVYILMGLIGIPVFSGFKSGVTALFGATGGYIFGFLFLAFLPGLVKSVKIGNKLGRAVMFYIASVIGLAICYFFGTAWFVILNHYTVSAALAACVLPFLAPDFIKLTFAALLAVRLEQYIK